MSGVVIAAIAVAVIATKLLFGPSGGASSPSGAVDGMLQAIARQDPVAALTLMDPDEVSGLDSVYLSLHDNLGKDGLVPDSGVFSGAELAFTNAEYDVDNVSEHVARVTVVGGDAALTVDPTAFDERFQAAANGLSSKTYSAPLPQAINDTWWFLTDCAPYWCPYQPDMGYDPDPDPSFVVVEKSGRWYISALGTVAEVIGERTDVGLGDYGLYEERVSREPVVGDTPEDAVRNTLEAVDTLDPDELLDTVPDGAMGILRAFSEVIVDELRAHEVAGDVTLRRLNTTVSDESRDRAIVTIQEASADVSFGNGDGDYFAATLGVRGECVFAEDDDGTEEECLPESFTDSTAIGEFSVLVRKVDGGWQVDPMSTAVHYLRKLASVPEGQMLAAFDIESLVPVSATFDGPGSQQVTLDEAGNAMIELQAKEGTYIVLSTEDDVRGWAELYPPDRWLNEDYAASRGVGGWGIDHGSGGAAEAFLVEQPGSYRLLIRGEIEDAGRALNLEVAISDSPPEWWDDAGW